MTNAEKLAKNTEFLSIVLKEFMCYRYASICCDNCPLYDKNKGGCQSNSIEKAKAWLESEAEDESTKDNND